MKELRFTIPGQTPSKKRNWTIVRTRRGRPRIALTKMYKDWEEAAASILWVQKVEMDMTEPIGYEVEVKFEIYLKGHYSVDLSNVIQSCEDALVVGGILEDDRLIMTYDRPMRHYGVPAGQERAEITIRPFKE